NLKNKKIYQDDYVLVVNKKHPIAKKKKISLEDYMSLSHIHISKRASGLGHVDTTLNRLGLTRRIALRAQHFLVAPYIIDQSNLAMTTIKSFSRGRDLKIFQLPFKINPLVLHLYWHGNKDKDPANKWMREIILNTYGKIQRKR
ncbi:MAG TPA: LysR family transcriptional regulator, partial [Gammaproteobacteria bacterium]|nr:LysR family transcriptional regulator [Gammaproteobacteria bacterium]